MSETVVIVVDLEVAGAPPATDSVRQLLVLIETLPSQGGELDWRLVNLSLNSPVRAELRPFSREGSEVPDQAVIMAAEQAFGILEAVNDDGSEPAVQRLPEESKRRLRTLLAPLRDRSGSFSIKIGSRPERVVRAAPAQRALAALAEVRRRPRPELGSIEGQILAATTYYGQPALRIRRFLTGEDVLCVFAPSSAAEIGAEHTLAEVWTGRRVVVSGKISFDGTGKAQVVYAEALRVLERQTVLEEIAAQIQGDVVVDDGWGPDA